MSSDVLLVCKFSKSSTLLVQQRPDVIQSSKSSTELFNNDIGHLDQSFWPSRAASGNADERAVYSGELEVVERDARNEGAEAGKKRIDLQDAIRAEISWSLLRDARCSCQRWTFR